MTKNNHPRNVMRALFVSPRIPAGVCILFVFFAMGITWYATTLSSRQQPAPLSSTLGETVALPGIDLVVESVRRDAHGTGPLVPRPGYEFVITTVTITNTSERPFELIPLLSFHVKDAAGNVYSVAAVPSESNQLSGPLLPHDKIREEIGFEVLKDAPDLRMVFEPGTPAHDVALINLTEDPGFFGWIPWLKTP